MTDFILTMIFIPAAIAAWAVAILAAMAVYAVIREILK